MKYDKAQVQLEKISVKPFATKRLLGRVKAHIQDKLNFYSGRRTAKAKAIFMVEINSVFEGLIMHGFQQRSS